MSFWEKGYEGFYRNRIFYASLQSRHYDWSAKVDDDLFGEIIKSFTPMLRWMVIYFRGHVSGTVGPLPYPMTECIERAAKANAQIDEAFTNPDIVRKITPIDGVKIIPTDLRFHCEEHEKRPANQHN